MHYFGFMTCDVSVPVWKAEWWRGSCLSNKEKQAFLLHFCRLFRNFGVAEVTPSRK